MIRSQEIVLGVDSSTQSTKVVAVDLYSGESFLKVARLTPAPTRRIRPIGGPHSGPRSKSP